MRVYTHTHKYVAQIISLKVSTFAKKTNPHTHKISIEENQTSAQMLWSYLLCWLNANLQTSSKRFVWVQLQRSCYYKWAIMSSTPLLKRWDFPKRIWFPGLVSVLSLTNRGGSAQHSTFCWVLGSFFYRLILTVHIRFAETHTVQFHPQSLHLLRSSCFRDSNENSDRWDGQIISFKIALFILKC